MNPVRIRKQLWADRKVVFVGTVLLLLSIFAQGWYQNLTRITYVEKCVLDAFAAVSRERAVTLDFVPLFIGVVVTRNELKPERIVRKSHRESTWFYLLVKLILIDLYLTFVTVFTTYLTGRMVSDQLCNWDQGETLYHEFTNSVLLDPNPNRIIFIFAGCIFTEYLIVSVVPLFCYWLFRSYVLGVLIILFFSANGFGQPIDLGRWRGVTWGVVKNGLDLNWQIFYPLIVFAVIAVLGSLFYKKDILK